MKRLLLYILFCLPIVVSAQDSLYFIDDSNKAELKRHTLFFELGGTSMLYSIKYDYILKQLNKFSINYSIGFSIVPGGGIGSYYYAILLPMELSGVYGKNKSKLELGVFILPVADIPHKDERLYDNGKNKYYLYKGGVEIGYRYQKKQGGLFFKASSLAFYSGKGWYSGYNFLPWIGIGIGHTFK